jgi:hypothetical protein
VDTLYYCLLWGIYREERDVNDERKFGECEMLERYEV